MIGFFIKKNFFDGWDNLLSLVFPNLLIFALVVGGYFVADVALNLSLLLSMLVLGIAVAQMPLKEIFCHAKDYLFILVRMIVLPVLCVLLLRNFVADPLILGVCCLMVSVPAANLPMMCSREYGLRTAELTRIIILSTLLSVLTIPVVVSFM